MATSPLSLGSPVHLGITTAFSGCVDTCSGWVSRRMTFDKSRFRYDKSYLALAWVNTATSKLHTFTICPLIDRVASRNNRWLMKNPYRSSLSRIGAAVWTISSRLTKYIRKIITHIGRLRGKYNDFIKLGYIS